MLNVLPDSNMVEHMHNTIRMGHEQAGGEEARTHPHDRRRSGKWGIGGPWHQAQRSCYRAGVLA